jgi:hypothetical protein
MKAHKTSVAYLTHPMPICPAPIAPARAMRSGVTLNMKHNGNGHAGEDATDGEFERY